MPECPQRHVGQLQPLATVGIIKIQIPMNIIEPKRIKMEKNTQQIIQHFPFQDFIASLDPPISPVANRSLQQLALAAWCL